MCKPLRTLCWFSAPQYRILIIPSCAAGQAPEKGAESISASRHGFRVLCMSFPYAAPTTRKASSGNCIEWQFILLSNQLIHIGRHRLSIFFMHMREKEGHKKTLPPAQDVWGWKMFFYAYVGLHGKDSFRAPHVLRRRCTFLRDIASIYVYVCVFFFAFCFSTATARKFAGGKFCHSPFVIGNRTRARDTFATRVLPSWSGVCDQTEVRKFVTFTRNRNRANERLGRCDRRKAFFYGAKSFTNCQRFWAQAGWRPLAVFPFASSMHFANVVSCPAGAVWTAIYEIT